MSKYMIHVCPDRKWYVDEFLIPSMIEQGISQSDITLWYDEKRKGNLVSCYESFADCGTRDGGTWHLQDDVIISRDFAEKTEKYDYGIVCGFVNDIFGPDSSISGENVPAVFAWNSFQCIRIPNDIAGDCAEWFYTYAKNQNQWQNWVAANKFDDSFWREYLMEKLKYEHVVNIKPCIVDHIDFLLGGSVINKWRGHIARATYWDDESLVTNLKDKLSKRAR